MKKQLVLIYLCLALTLANISFLLYYFCFTDKTAFTNRPADRLTFPAEHPVTTDVALPEEMDFAGEKVPLHRKDVQEALRKELIVNTYLHSHSVQILKNAPRAFAVIEPLLKKAGIPDDFKYLAVIESNLNPTVVSPAGAVGVWQFMNKTAKEYGLEVNSEVDERYHTEKATLAATRYLRKAYERFGSWTVAAASYNAGTSMLLKQMNIQQENNYYNLLLGEETERYVFRILALKQILTHPERYHFYVPDPYPVEKTRRIKVNGPVEDWTEFAKKHHVSYKTLKRFNPWLRKTKLKNPKRKTYEIILPANPKLYK